MGNGKRRPGATAIPVSAAQVVDAAREVIRLLEPEELVVFDATAASWLSGDLPAARHRREPGAAVGFGVEAVLLSELVFPIISGALSQVLGTRMLERIGARRRAAGSATGSSDVGDPEAGDPGGRDGQQAGLTVEQLRNIHDVCRHDAAALGLAPAKATLLADAVVGSLCAAPRGSRP